jgi:hypothetical protein
MMTFKAVPMWMGFLAFCMVLVLAGHALAEKPVRVDSAEGTLVKWNSTMPPEVVQSENRVVVRWRLVPIFVGLGGVRYMHIPMALEYPDQSFGLMDLWWWLRK